MKSIYYYNFKLYGRRKTESNRKRLLKFIVIKFLTWRSLYIEQEKAETELKRLRQSLCFKARPLPDFYKQRVAPNNQMEKVTLSESILKFISIACYVSQKDWIFFSVFGAQVPLTHSESPEPGRKMTPGKIRSASQLPQWSSLKNSGSKDAMQKKSDNPRSLASRLKASPRENTSPNIQHEWCGGVVELEKEMRLHFKSSKFINVCKVLWDYRDQIV